MDQESCSVYKEIIVWGPDRCNKTWCRCISNMNSLGWNPTESQEWGRWRSCLSAVVVCGKLNKSCLALHNENTFIAWSLHNGSFSFSGILSTWSATICEAYSITWKHVCYPLRCSYVSNMCSGMTEAQRSHLRSCAVLLCYLSIMATKQWNYTVSVRVEAKGQLHPLLQNPTNSAHDSEEWVEPVL